MPDFSRTPGDRMGFGEALRLVRKARGWTQAELAERAKPTYSRTQVVRIERERKWPQHHQSLLHALELDGTEFMAQAHAARERLATAPRTVAARCESCGTRIDPPGARRGRPRKRCPSCSGDRSALGRAWRAANPDRVDEYNRARREAASAMSEGKVV